MIRIKKYNFENQVIVITKDNNKIESNFAKLNKRTKDLILKDNVKLEDANQNLLKQIMQNITKLQNF